MLGILLYWIVPAVLVSLVILAGALWTVRRQRNCPSCQTAMRTIDGPHQTDPQVTYEVLVCSDCTNVATLVHGQKNRFAYCPSCLNRSLRTPIVRLPDTPSGPRVKVAEQCEICSYQAERILGAPPQTQSDAAPRGKVIPFRRRGETDPPSDSESTGSQ